MAGPPGEPTLLSGACIALREQTREFPGGIDAHGAWITQDGTDMHVWVKGEAVTTVHGASRDCPCGPQVIGADRKWGREWPVVAHPVVR